MSDLFPTLRNIPATTAYRTEPVLGGGAQIVDSRALLIGQRTPEPAPRAALLLGKVIELTPARSLHNWSVWLDATFPHVGLIAGKRGSGKSYDLGIIAEGLCCANGPVSFGVESFAMVMFDTQNQFWTLARERSAMSDDQQGALTAWGIGAVELAEPTIYRPRGTTKLADFEVEFGIRPSDLTTQEWTGLIGVDRFDAMGQCLRGARRAVESRTNFGIDDMTDWLDSDDCADRFQESTRNGVRWRLEAAADSGLFDPGAEDVAERLARSGQKSVIQLADLDDDVKSIVVAVILRRITRAASLAQRRRRLGRDAGATSGQTDVAPRIWTLIDEAHLVCPSERETSANPVIIDYVKRGRDAGLSLIVATQQPSALDSRITSQADLVIIHKLTVDSDIAAATARMPARPPQKTTRGGATSDLSSMSELARSFDAGEGLLADSESTRAFVMQSRPRISPHGGGEPEL